MSAKRGILKTFAAIGNTVASAANPNPAKVSGDMSANIIGPSTTIDIMDQVCYQVHWTGTPTGTINIQGSVDNSTWDTLDPASFTPPIINPAGSAGGQLINLALTPFPYIRLIYTAASGSGTMTCNMSAKGN